MGANPDGPLPEYVKTCGWTSVVMAKFTGGAYSARLGCKSWRCDKCAKRQASGVIELLRHRAAGIYVGYALPGQYFGPNSLIDNIYINKYKDSRTKITTWMFVVFMPHEEHESTLLPIRKYANRHGIDWLAIRMTDRVVIFASGDLAAPNSAGSRGRPFTRLAIVGQMVSPDEAGGYLDKALYCGDVLKKPTTSDGWAIAAEKSEKKANNTSKFAFKGDTGDIRTARSLLESVLVDGAIPATLLHSDLCDTALVKNVSHMARGLYTADKYIDSGQFAAALWEFSYKLGIRSDLSPEERVARLRTLVENDSDLGDFGF